MSEFDKNKKTGDTDLNAEQPSTYDGFKFTPAEDPKVARKTGVIPKARSKSTEVEDPVSDAEREQQRLLRLLNETELFMPEFLELADISIRKGEEVINRIDTTVGLIADDPIQLTDPDKALLENFIGKSVIDKAGAKCLTKIAYFNDLPIKYDAYLEEDDPLENPERPLDEMFDEKRIEEAFPDFGFKFIILIIKMTYEFIIIKLLGKLCDLLKPVPIVKVLVKTVIVPAGRALLSLVGRGKINVCEEDPDLEVILARWIANRDFTNAETIDTNPDELDPDLPEKRCEPGYKPSYADITIAQKLVEIGIRKEQDATNNVKVAKQEAKKAGSSFMLTNMSLLERLRSDSHTFTTTAKGVVHKANPLPGFFIKDKAEAGMLGFFANLNGIMQKADAGVTKILSLQFLDEDSKQWICCIVRFIYLILPRITAIKFSEGNRDRASRKAADIVNKRKGEINGRLNAGESLESIIDEVATTTSDAAVAAKIKEYGNSDNFKHLLEIDQYLKEGIQSTFSLDQLESLENAKQWIALVDAILSFMLGSVAISININFNFANFFLNIVKQGISEAGAVLMTALYSTVKDKMFGIINRMRTNLPDVALALETCKPFDWFLKTLECSIENLFTKLQEFIAQLWLDANEGFADIDASLTVTATNKSFKLFQNLFTLLLKWDQALINFCSLKKTATAAQRREVIDRAVKSIVTSVNQKPGTTLDQAQFNAKLEGARAVFSPNINLAPDGSDPYFTQMGANPLVRNIREFHNEMFGNVAPPDPTQPVQKPTPSASPTPAEALKESVKGCGDGFKALLRSRLDDIEEIHRAVADEE